MWLVFFGLLFLAYISGALETEDWTEAHDLEYANGLKVSPEQHERNVEEWSRKLKEDLK